MFGEVREAGVLVGIAIADDRLDTIAKAIGLGLPTTEQRHGMPAVKRGFDKARAEKRRAAQNEQTHQRWLFCFLAHFFQAASNSS